MDLTQLQALGAIVPGKLFKKEVPIRRPLVKPENEWADPDVPEFTGEIVDDSLTIFVRKRNSADFMQIRTAPNRDKWHMALMLSVCKEDGTPVFDTIEKAQALQDWLFIPIMTAVNEVNGEAAKNSQPRTNGGASSRSDSAGARSRNGKKRSARASSSSGKRTPPTAAH